MTKVLCAQQAYDSPVGNLCTHLAQFGKVPEDFISSTIKDSSKHEKLHNTVYNE